MIDYWNDWKLLNARAEDTRMFNENASLYTVEYILKTNDQRKGYDLVNFYLSVKLADGLYNQLPLHAGNNDDYMSHDQLTAMMIISKKYNLGLHQDIWKEVKRQGFRYNNIEPGKGWILHPRDTIFYGMLAGSKLWYLMYPILLIIMIISQFGQDTSGKCLNWIRCQGMNWSWTLKILGWFMPYKSWADVFQVYFPDPNHPINVSFRE
jgi:hypothetical protein